MNKTQKGKREGEKWYACDKGTLTNDSNVVTCISQAHPGSLPLSVHWSFYKSLVHKGKKYTRVTMKGWGEGIIYRYLVLWEYRRSRLDLKNLLLNMHHIRGLDLVNVREDELDQLGVLHIIGYI